MFDIVSMSAGPAASQKAEGYSYPSHPPKINHEFPAVAIFMPQAVLCRWGAAWQSYSGRLALRHTQKDRSVITHDDPSRSNAYFDASVSVIIDFAAAFQHHQQQHLSQSL